MKLHLHSNTDCLLLVGSLGYLCKDNPEDLVSRHDTTIKLPCGTR